MRLPEKKQWAWAKTKKKERHQGKHWKEGNKFYNSRRWRKHRESYLARFPLCVVCDSKGIVTEAKVLDHIVPIRQGGDLFDENNLQGLCWYHHNQKSGRESHKYRQSQKGKEGL